MASVLIASAIGVPPALAAEPVVQPVSGLSLLAAVWCRSDNTCLGVGETPSHSGGVVLLGPTGVGPVRPVPGTRTLSAITCLPAGNCLAVGQGSQDAVVADLAADGTPRAVRSVPGAIDLYGIACPTATTCLATGRRLVERPPYSDAPTPSAPVYTVITNGAPATAQWYPRGSPLFVGISCPTSTRCLAVGQGTIAVLTGSRGSWTATTRTVSGTNWSGRPAEAISCPSPARCFTTAIAWVAADEGHYAVPAIMPVSPDGVPGPIRALTGRSGNALDISCVADGVCTVVGNDNWAGQGLVVDVRPAGRPVPTLLANTNWLGGVSCVTASSCGISGAAAGVPQVPVFAWRS
jgi:hypothetical protein